MYKKLFFEVIKLSACLLGVISLYLSIVSLVNLNYVPGCPPTAEAEALMYGILQLQKKIRRTGTVER